MVASQRYTIRDTPAEDIIVHATATHTTTILAAEIEVLRDFAAAYTRGEHDWNVIAPYGDVQPIGIILVRASQHTSNYTPLGLGTTSYLGDRSSAN
ncbi:hypothetical protein E4U13_007502 [Claviceps humidiphila]|uniref:Uncharacterized protein n=1 Tax=Claviceps humidiphila TaxID=1294629 RepID=A0A9P7TRX8_9HYPO|nr:hypothetical protein E4U13_007502 [Claviceps humidiphila]KAG6109039.1 hypothetical protein E4U31_007243 [Claviceps sp. LM219 group G6]